LKSINRIRILSGVKIKQSVTPRASPEIIPQKMMNYLSEQIYRFLALLKVIFYIYSDKILARIRGDVQLIND